jgi:hypothetical protein
MSRGSAVLAFGLLASLPCPAPACTLCGGNPATTATIRQDLGPARMVLYGTVADSRMIGNGGTTDLKIDRVLRSDPFLGDKKVITLPRFVPNDKRNPTKLLVFCDIAQGKLDPFRGIPVQSPALVDYVKGVIELDPKDRNAALVYFFRYLDHADPVVANDAFVEFAKANDAEIGQVARRLDAEKLRKLIQDPQTPAARLSLFTFLLGSCGTERDAAYLKGIIENPTGRTANALDGALAGYIQLQPRAGWEAVANILRDDKRGLTPRLQALSAVRFHRAWRGKDVEREVYRSLEATLADPLIADKGAEYLREWQLWDLTDRVLGLWDKKGFDSPIFRRSVVRYALTCPKTDAARFLERLKSQKDGKEMVQEVEESLQADKVK